jgi:thymidine phosphorylase
MQLRDLTTSKRDGIALTPEQIRWFLGAYTRGELADYHAAGLLGTIFVRGLDEGELSVWTRAMLESTNTPQVVWATRCHCLLRLLWRPVALRCQ